VFVSHNLAAVRSLCPRALVLRSGKLIFDGPTDEAVHQYLRSDDIRGDGVVEGRSLELRVVKTRIYGDAPFFTCKRVSALNDEGVPSSSFRSDEPVTVEVDFVVHRRLPGVRVLVTLTDENQVAVLRTESVDEIAQSALEPGEYRASVTIVPNLLGEVELDLNVSLIAEVMQVVDYGALMSLEFTFAGYDGNMRGKAYLRPRLPWEIRSLSPVDSVVE